jgi:hypothetical protein
MTIKTYSELRRLETFDERLNYLKLYDSVGRSTFGYDRYLNQRFYTSYVWKRARQEVIVRDNGCDLGVRGYEIHSDLYVHHINPMSADDIIHGEEWLLDPEFLITTTISTHNSIHFGDDNSFPKVVVARSRNDTKLW